MFHCSWVLLAIFSPVWIVLVSDIQILTTLLRTVSRQTGISCLKINAIKVTFSKIILAPEKVIQYCLKLRSPVISHNSDC